MSKQIVAGLVLVAVLATSGMSQQLTRAAHPAPPAPGLELKSESQLWVEGGSTVRDYKCKATRLDADIQTSGVPGSIANLGSVVTGVTLNVPVQEMSCGNGTMEGHMRKALKADASPQIRFELASHEVDAQGQLTMRGTLSIAGTEKPTTLTATVTEEAAGLRVRGSKDLRMTEFGVKPPTLMMGTMKVKDAVVVHFDLLLKK